MLSKFVSSFRWLIITVGIVVLLNACGGGGGGGSTSGGSGGGGGGGTTINGTSANAGSDQSVSKGSLVTLSGSGTSGSGAGISYSWTQLSGVAVSLNSPLTAQSTFTAPGIGGDLEFQLSVYDGTTLVTDNVIVTVTNQAPTASASAAATSNGGESVMLSALGSSDPDGDSLYYTWSQSGGTTVNLNNFHSPTPFFVAPSGAGALSFDLTVSDGEATSSVASVTINNSAYSGSHLAAWTQNPFIKLLPQTNIRQTVVSGNYAYMAADSDGLQIYDISDIRNPVLVGSYTETNWSPDTLDVSGSVAVAAGGTYPSQVRVIDVSTPASPSLSASLTSTFVHDIDIVGSVAYIASSDYDLQLLDISTPASAAYITTNPSNNIIPGLAEVQSVEVVGTLAYMVVTQNKNFVILDISDPTTDIPVVSTTSGNFNQPWDIKVSGNYAYVTDATNGLKIFDISTPSSPAMVGEVALDGANWGVQLVGSTAYIASGTSGGLSVVDVTDVTAPVLTGLYYTPGSAQQVTVANQMAYVWDYGVGLQFIDVSAVSVPDVIRTVGDSADGTAVVVNNGIAYLADKNGTGSGGLRMFDVSDPLAPAVIDIYAPSGAKPRGVTMIGNSAYLARGASGLEIADVFNPSSVGVIGTNSTTDDARAIAVEGDYAYLVTVSSGGLQVYDVTSPSAPNNVASESFTNNADNIVVRNGKAYIAGTFSGLHIVDVTTPASPSLLGTTSLPGSAIAYDVEISGNIAYVSDSNSFQAGGLYIYDTTNPASSTLLGSYDQPTNGIDLAGNVLYTTEETNLSTTSTIKPAVRIFDVTDPAAPALAGEFYVSSNARDIAINNDFFYTALKTGGLGIMQREPTIATRYTSGTQGAVLSYTVSWAEFPGSDAVQVECEVTAGSCSVDSIDQLVQAATLSWTLPSTPGDNEIAIAVGDQHAFYSTLDHVTVQ